MSLSLLKAKKLTFTIFQEGQLNGDGFFDDGPEISFEVLGSLQPFSGSSRNVLPEGVSSTDVRVFFTKDPILTVNQLDNTQAYEVDIGGFPYVVSKSGPWVESGLSLNHYRVILIRKDKNENKDQ